jgi:hypothetical protein
MAIAPEELSEDLRRALDGDLVSVVLYGSGARGDRNAKSSDYNLLVIVSAVNADLLDRAAPVVGPWVNQGNPAPLFFTRDRFLQAEDVFPVEFLEIQSSRRVLAGDDVFAGLVIRNDNLRHQLEYELRGKLLALRQIYFARSGKDRPLTEAVVAALPALFALFRGVLRLAGEAPPVERPALLDALGRRVGLDRSAFASALEARDGHPPAMAGRALFEGVTASLERVIDFVDGFPAG